MGVVDISPAVTWCPSVLVIPAVRLDDMPTESATKTANITGRRTAVNVHFQRLSTPLRPSVSDLCLLGLLPFWEMFLCTPSAQRIYTVAPPQISSPSLSSPPHLFPCPCPPSSRSSPASLVIQIPVDDCHLV